MDGNTMLKGGLHCHTTRSDGRGTPEEVIRLHAEHHYDFLALTDHRIYNYQNFAPETGVLIVPGMEFDNPLPQPYGWRHFHTVVLGPDDETNPYKQDQRWESGTSVSQDGFQTYLDKFHADRQLTFYCHPEWSATPARMFDKMKGHFAMEVWNSGCVMENEMDDDAAYWDELLGQGVHINGVAVDDGHLMEQHCHGWVMVNAKKNVASILEALAAGQFYSSCGPTIYDFYVKRGEAHVISSPCSKVRFHANCVPTQVVHEQDGPLTHTVVKLSDRYRYVRAVVVDHEGRQAWTNPIWMPKKLN